MKIEISPTLPLFLVSLAASKDILAVVIPLSAAFIHECGHLAAAKAMKIRITSMRLGIFGAAINTDLLQCSYRKEALFALCGPLANLISSGLFLAIFGIRGQYSLLFLISSLFFAVLNLLPAGSFDGGRIFTSALHSILSERIAHYVAETVSFITVFILWLTSVYLIFKTGAYLSLFIFSLSLFAALFLSESSRCGRN